MTWREGPDFAIFAFLFGLLPGFAGSSFRWCLGGDGDHQAVMRAEGQGAPEAEEGGKGKS